jgi:hypothetical protein
MTLKHVTINDGLLQLTVNRLREISLNAPLIYLLKKGFPLHALRVKLLLLAQYESFATHLYWLIIDTKNVSYIPTCTRLGMYYLL